MVDSKRAYVLLCKGIINVLSTPTVTAVTAAIEVEAGSSTFRVRCTSTGGRALNMAVSGPNGYISDLSSTIEPESCRRFLGNYSYTAATALVSNRSPGYEYQCNVTSFASNTGSVTVEGNGVTLLISRGLH